MCLTTACDMGAVRANRSEIEINERRLQVINSCRQTKISRGFSLIVDDSGHRKSAPPARSVSESVKTEQEVGILPRGWEGNTSEKLVKLIMG